MAQRLQAVAKENQVIISEASYLKVKESFKCERVGEVALRHKSQPVIIYQVLD
jgi:class 3 adenylate cyclase